jgi:lipoyl(octanoyl) transferase
MTEPWRLLHTSPAHGAWNMAVDESILEHIGRGESRPTLRLYAWQPACLSLGHAQPFADVDMDRLQERGWQVVRRLTGGRAILHTDELTYSVTGSAEEPVLAGGVLESYNHLSQALLYAIQDLGLAVEIEKQTKETSPLGQNPNPVCFEMPSAYEITVQGKKLIGSAQARRKDGVLQHGSLPLSGDLGRICEALVFKDNAARLNAAQRLLRRAATVESTLGRRVDWDIAAQAFVRGFEAQLGIRFEQNEMSQSELTRADELVREKYAHTSWTGRA